MQPSPHLRSGQHIGFARRKLLAALLLALASALPCLPTTAQAQPAWPALRDGDIVLLRHANAPGTGDPPGLRLDDCSTQRNLDEAGRRQARRIGEQFRRRGIVVGGVLTSEWCRARETAAQAFPALPARVDSAFNSFFADRSREPAQTRSAQATLQRWRGPGVLVVTTHQVNIGALTGINPASGEGVALRAQQGRLAVLGRLPLEGP